MKKLQPTTQYKKDLKRYKKDAWNATSIETFC